MNDGTDAGTSLLFNAAYMGLPYVFNGTIFFSNFSSAEGYELWSYTPTVSGITNISNTQLEMTVYPNPVKNELTLVFEDNSLKQLEIINVLGEVVIKTSTNNLVYKINTENLTNGVYFIRLIDNNNEIKTTKFIKG